MRRRDDAARPERRRDRRGERLGQRQHLRPGPGRGGAVAGDDHEAARAGQQRGGALDVALVGDRPVQRNAPRLGFDDRRLGGLPEFDHVALQAVEIEMGRARRVGQRGAPGMPQQPRQFAGGIDRGRELRHRREQRRVRDFLVGVAVLERRLLVAGQRDDRAAPEPGILQAGGEIGGADRLRHAHAGPAGDAGIAVGHIGRRLFGMRQDRPDAEIARAAAACGASPIRQKRHGSCRCRPAPAPAIPRRSSSPDRSLLSSPGRSFLFRPCRLRAAAFRRLRCETATDRSRQRSRNERDTAPQRRAVPATAFRKPAAETRIRTLRKSPAPLT